MAENGERQERLDRARAAVAAYQEVDHKFAIGGLSFDRYNMLLGDAEPAMEDLSTMEKWQLGWLQFEHALASSRHQPEGIKVSVHRKQVASRIERAKNTLRAVRKAESLSPAQRALLQAEIASLDLYTDIALASPMVSPAARKHYAGTLLGIAEHYEQYFDEPDNNEAHTITAALLLVNLADNLDTSFYLPAPPRQSWHLNAYDSYTQLPHRIFITDGSQEAPDDAVVLLHAMLETTWPSDEDFGLYPTLGAMYQCRRNYDIQHSSQKLTDSSAYSAYLRTVELRPPLASVANTIEQLIATSPTPEQVVVLPEVVMEEVAERGLLPAAEWYLNVWNGEVNDDFITRMRSIELARTEESLLPEEQRILGWMELVYAQHLAVHTEDDATRLAAAREQFKIALDTFFRAAKGFERTQKPGDLIDVLFTIEAAQAYRALYTSTDKYAIKKQMSAYTEKVAELFLLIRANAAKLAATDEQMQLITTTIERVLLCLLQTGAPDEFEKRVIVPASIKAPEDVIAFVSESTDQATTYDLARQVVIHIVDGDELKAKPNELFVGREQLGKQEELLALLGEVAATLIRIEQPQAASKKAKGKAAAKSQKASKLPQRSAALTELTEAIWFKIFDAAEGIDDDVKD